MFADTPPPSTPGSNAIRRVYSLSSWAMDRHFPTQQPLPSLLVVEDDPVHQEIAQYHLRKLVGRVGSVQTCATLGAAEEHLEKHHVDLVLLDLTLPDSPLEGTIESLRRLTERFSARFVALSALDAPEVRERVQAQGALAFLPKGELSAERLGALLNAEASPPPEPREAGEGVDQREAQLPPDAPDPTGDATPLEVRELASKISHDASSWLANLTFRISALRAELGTTGSEAANAHLNSLAASAEALEALIRGARTVVNDELSELDLSEIELGPWLDEFGVVWSTASGHQGIELGTEGLPRVMADDHGLAQVVHALLDNTRAYGRQTDPMRVTFRPLDAGSPHHACVEMHEEGAPWNVKHLERLLKPLTKGDRSSTRPGFGLFRAKRWMERMGGTLQLVATEGGGAPSLRLIFRTPNGA